MIPAAQSYKWLSDRYTLKRTTNGWWMMDCPFCGKRGKFAVHFAWNVGKCWSCEWRNGVVDIVMQTEDLTYVAAARELHAADGEGIDPEMFVMARSMHVANVELPQGYRSLVDGYGKTVGQRAIDYLTGRGFDVEKLDAMGFGYVGTRAKEVIDDYFGYIIMPIKQDGRLRYFIARGFMDQFIKYKNPREEIYGVGKNQVIYNADAFNLFDTVYVMEGVFDALTLGDRAAATLGWSWSHQQIAWMIESTCKTIVIVADKGFYSNAVGNAVKLMDHKEVRVVNFDAIEDGKDVNDIGRKRTMQLIKNTPVLTMEHAFEVMGR